MRVGALGSGKVPRAFLPYCARFPKKDCIPRAPEPITLLSAARCRGDDLPDTEERKMRREDLLPNEHRKFATFVDTRNTLEKALPVYAWITCSDLTGTRAWPAETATEADRLLDLAKRRVRGTGARVRLSRAPEASTANPRSYHARLPRECRILPARHLIGGARPDTINVAPEGSRKRLPTPVKGWERKAFHRPR